KLTAHVLFEEATIRHIAAALDEKVTASPIVAVRSGTKRPFFFLHGDFVESGLYCLSIARGIGPNRPFYAMDPHRLQYAAPRTIEAMAVSRIEALRGIQPRGPYLLGGFCNGGLIAFEMARQLEAA